MGHFAREYNEPKKAELNFFNTNLTFVSSSVLLDEFFPLWIVDSRATDHVAKG